MREVRLLRAEVLGQQDKDEGQKKNSSGLENMLSDYCIVTQEDGDGQAIKLPIEYDDEASGVWAAVPVGSMHSRLAVRLVWR